MSPTHQITDTEKIKTQLSSLIVTNEYPMEMKLKRMLRDFLVKMVSRMEEDCAQLVEYMATTSMGRLYSTW